MTEQKQTQPDAKDGWNNHDWDGRIGEKMRQAVRRVATTGPYGSKNQLAISVGPHGSQDYGYQIVDRCISRGLLTTDAEHDASSVNYGWGAVVLTDKGRAYYQQVIQHE